MDDPYAVYNKGRIHCTYSVIATLSLPRKKWRKRIHRYHQSAEKLHRYFTEEANSSN
jgi:hypothetical protein